MSLNKESEAGVTAAPVVEASPVMEGTVAPVVEASPVMEGTVAPVVGASPVMEGTVTPVVEASPVMEGTVTPVVEASPVMEETVAPVVEASLVMEGNTTTVQDTTPPLVEDPAPPSTSRVYDESQFPWMRHFSSFTTPYCGYTLRLKDAEALIQDFQQATDSKYILRKTGGFMCKKNGKESMELI